MPPSKATATEAVGVFRDAAGLQGAIDELLSHGFDRAELSLLASRATVEEKLGHRYRKVQELEDDRGVPTRAYVSTESLGDAEGAIAGILMYVGAVAAAGAVVASGGAIAAAIAAGAAAGGAGGGLGAVLARYLDRGRADYLAEQLESGGLLLWVRTRDREHEVSASAILKRNGAEDVHLHDVAAAQAAGQDALRRMDEIADEASRESFPASDAPSFNPGTAGAR